ERTAILEIGQRLQQTAGGPQAMDNARALRLATSIHRGEAPGAKAAASPATPAAPARKAPPPKRPATSPEPGGSKGNINPAIADDDDGDELSDPRYGPAIQAVNKKLGIA